MAKKIVLRLNESQKAKIKKKFKRVCDTLEVDESQLANITKYISPKICLDFDDAQEKIVQEVFPEKECDFAMIDISDLGAVILYMPPKAINPNDA